MSKIVSRAISDSADSARRTSTLGPTSVPSVSDCDRSGTCVTSDTSMSSPLPFISVPQDDRSEVHQEDERDQDEDGGRGEILELLLRLLDVHEDQRREGCVVLLELIEQATLRRQEPGRRAH